MSAPQERRGAPANWLPYVAVAISLASMFFGPCFGAAVAVVGNYVTKQSDAAVLAEQRRQDSEKLKTIGDKVEEIFKLETKSTSEIEHIKADADKESAERIRETSALRRDVDENLKILNTYASKVEGRQK